MSRTITIISTQGDQRVTLDSNATTWGQLKAEINDEGTMSANDAKAMIRGTRESLDKSGDALPTGDFSVFLTPQKIKSGKESK
jgi:hypothetical protein